MLIIKIVIAPLFFNPPTHFFSFLSNFFSSFLGVLLISLITILIGWVLPILVDDSIVKLLKQILSGVKSLINQSPLIPQKWALEYYHFDPLSL